MHLHDQNIIHGDLALRNILYHSKMHKCAISDFGLAHRGIQKENLSSKLPIRWLAPEVFTTKK